MSNSLTKAFEIVEYIANNPPSMRLKDISFNLNMNKTTVFRYLETLEKLNIIEKNENLYSLGLKLFVLGNKVKIKDILIKKIRPFLENLSKEINETINLVQYFENKALYLDKVESNRSLQMKSSIGDTLPLHCTALGKSILSILDESELVKILKKIDFREYTENTIKDRASLIKEIHKTNTIGYSIETEEFEKGLACVAIPLKLENMNFYGALSISGPVERMKINYVKKSVKKLTETRDLINKKLGEEND